MGRTSYRSYKSYKSYRSYPGLSPRPLLNYTFPCASSWSTMSCRLVRGKPRATPPTRAAPREERVRAAFGKLPVGSPRHAGRALAVRRRALPLADRLHDRGARSRITLQSVTHPDDAKNERPLMKRLVSRRARPVPHREAAHGAKRPLRGRASPHRARERHPDLRGRRAAAVDRRSSARAWRSSAPTAWRDHRLERRRARRSSVTRRAEIVGKNRRVLYRDADGWSGKSTGVMRRAAANGWRWTTGACARTGTHFWVRCAHRAVRAWRRQGLRRDDHGAAPIVERLRPSSNARNELEKRGAPRSRCARRSRTWPAAPKRR